MIGYWAAPSECEWWWLEMATTPRMGDTLLLMADTCECDPIRRCIDRSAVDCCTSRVLSQITLSKVAKMRRASRITNTHTQTSQQYAVTEMTQSHAGNRNGKLLLAHALRHARCLCGPHLPHDDCALGSARACLAVQSHMGASFYTRVSRKLIIHQ